MKIAYLVNCYPAASHSFIRREIAAIESVGGNVSRYSVRTSDLALLPDIRDHIEYGKTIVILNNPWPSLIFSLLIKMMMSPVQFLRALKIAFGKSSFRPSDLIRRTAYLAEAAWLANQLAKNDIQHLHAHFGTNSTMVARLSHEFGGPPYSFTVHGPDEFDQPIELDLTGKIADSAFCVAISSFGRGQLMRWCNVADWSKIEVVRCGVDEKFIEECPTTPITTQPRFCAVARLSGQKGIPLLVEAAAQLKQEGYSFTIELVGGGEMYDQITKMVRDNNVHDCVVVIGWASSDEIVRRLLAARAMVLPSFAEGLPVVIMEALALKRPVIVTAIAGTPELVDDQCGWLIPSGSVEALIGALKSALAASSQTLAEKGQVGRERVVSLHNARQNGSDLYRLIKQYHKLEG